MGDKIYFKMKYNNNYLYQLNISIHIIKKYI